MEKFDVIVVGAGLSGIAAAYNLAKEGLEVLVIERGDYAGAKNVTGGRIYLNQIRHFFPEHFWEKAPLERPVTNECLTMLSEHTSTTLRFRSDKFSCKPYQSYTIQRGKFDRWFANQAAEQGAMFVTKTRVDDLIWHNEQVVGVVAGGEELGAKVVVACDGALSLMAEKAKLRVPGKSADFAVGFKEIIELSEKTIEDRFNLVNGEGLAHLFMGSLTKGRFGGGFLYTNKSTLSLGMVVGIRDLRDGQPTIKATELLEEFKKNTEITQFIAGGELVEYSAHVIPEAGYYGLNKNYGDGIIVAGDAAGFALNMGITVRGMENAIASGILAAETVKQAFVKEDYSAKSLAKYDNFLSESCVMKDLKTFKDAPHVMDNERNFTYYPQLVGEILQDLYSIDDQPLNKFTTTLRRHFGFADIVGIAKDVWKGRKL